MHTILELGAHLGECHPGARQLPFVAQFARRDPHRGQRAVVQQEAQPVGVELVRLMHVTHHELRLRRVRQVRHTSGLLNLIHDPIPVAYRLEGNGSAWRERGEEGPDRAWLVIDPPPAQNLAVPVEDSKQ